VKRFLAHEDLPTSQFIGRGKVKSLLILYCWVALGITSQAINSSLATGNYLKAFLLLRQTTEPEVVILNTCYLGSNIVTLIVIFRS